MISELIAVTSARSLIDRAGINTIPVDLDLYLDAVGARVQVRRDLRDDEAGQTIPLEDHNLIFVNGNHRIERQRFTVLHEVAHIELQLPSIHGDGLTTELLNGYGQRPMEEILCDVFASECLLPHTFFRNDLSNLDIGLDAVRELAEKYEASITATASRYANNHPEPCAMVLSEKGIVRFVAKSPAMREFGFWVDFGVAVPPGSVAHRTRQSGDTTDYDEIPAAIWTGADSFRALSILEEAVALGRWEQIVSILWFENERDLSKNAQRSTSIDDELLPELDGHLPWPGRRRRR